MTITCQAGTIVYYALPNYQAAFLNIEPEILPPASIQMFVGPNLVSTQYRMAGNARDILQHVVNRAGQQAIADLISTSQQNISRWVIGQTNIRLNATQWAHLLAEYTADYLCP